MENGKPVAGSAQHDKSALIEWLASKEAEKIRRKKKLAAEDLISAITYDTRIGSHEMQEEVKI